jgi:hypothetical protein
MKLRNSILVCVVLTLATSAGAKAEPLYSTWLTKLGSSSPAVATQIAPVLAEATNVFVLGTFTNSTTIGSTTLTNLSGEPSVMLVKFTKNVAAPRWVRAPISEAAITKGGVIADFGGNAYVAGQFAGSTIAFGGTSLTNYAPSQELSDDVFLAKYGSSGELLWARQFGGASPEAFAGIGFANAGGANGFYLGGAFESLSFSAGTHELTRQGSTTDCFVIRCDMEGNVVWAQQGSNAEGTVLCADSGDNCYLGGRSLGTSTFGSTTPSNPTGNHFLAKYNSAGSLLWVRGDVTIGTRLKVDRQRNIYTTGIFTNTTTIGETTLTSSACSSIFLAKYDPTGELLWAREVPGAGCNMVADLGFDSLTNCWVAGWSSEPGLEGSSENPRALIARFAPDGELLTQANGNPEGLSMAAGIGAMHSPFGTAADLFVCGTFATNYAMGGRTITNEGTPDIFVGWLVATPRLGSMTTGTNILVTWPPVADPRTQTVLEASDDINGTSWTSAGPASFVNGQYWVTNAIAEDVKFYRLKVQ